MKVTVYDTKKKKVGQLDLPDAVFAAEVKEALLWEQVKAQRASRRRGTAKTKRRGEVRGGGAKPFRQKGTGRHRQGSSRDPSQVGGGTVWGPVPRDYSYRLPRSARRAALCSALSVRVKEDALIVLDKFEIETPKTKDVMVFLSDAKLSSALIVDVENGNLQLSTRNVPKTKFLAAEGINVYDILNHDSLVVTQAAVETIVRHAEPKSHDAAASAD